MKIVQGNTSLLNLNSYLYLIFLDFKSSGSEIGSNPTQLNAVMVIISLIENAGFDKLVNLMVLVLKVAILEVGRM